jgi:catechol 2,3-dioxygenase-like lactoylglutathione lyase family enzyme
VLRVRNLAASIAFYEQVLDCAVERRIDELGLVQLRAGRSLIDLVGVDTPLGRAGGEEPDANARNLDHFALVLDTFDEDRILSHLARHEIDGSAPAARYGADGFGPSIYIQDPDGNTVELKGPPHSPVLPDPDSGSDTSQRP